MERLKRLKEQLKNVKNRGATSSVSYVTQPEDTNGQLQCGTILPSRHTTEEHVSPTSDVVIPSKVSVETRAQELWMTRPTAQQASSMSVSQRLWNAAYDSLEKEKDTKELVQAYLKTLVKVIGAEPEDRNVSAEDLKDPNNRQLFMEKLVRDGRVKVEKTSKITRGVAEFAKAVLLFKPMADLVIQNTPHAAPAALPWAGICAALQILSNPAMATKSNLDGIVHVVSRMDWYCALDGYLLEGTEPQHAILHQLEQRVIALYKALLRYQMESACSYYRPQGYVFLRSIVLRDDWDGYLKDVTDAEESLRSDFEQYGKLKKSGRWHELLKQARDMQSCLGNIHHTLQTFVDQQKKLHRDDKDKICLQDLCLVDPHDDMEKIEKKKDQLLDVAYNWILQTKEYAAFTSWDNANASQSRSLMWVKGNAGTGKTMLLMGIIRQLSNQPATYTPSVSHFFCQSTNTALNSAIATLRSLVWLLLVQQPHLLPHLRSKYDNVGPSIFDGDTAFISLSNVFKSMLKDPDLCPVYFVVDALDECERGRTDLIGLINNSLLLSNKVKWLVSSRPSVELKSVDTAGHLIELDAQKLRAPVDVFVKHKLSILRDREGYNPDILSRIEEEVSQRAKNTFLWVALALKELDVEDADSNLLHGSYALETIKGIPPGLSELYGHIMIKIQKGLKKDPQYCKAVLASAVLAYRPLSPSELAVAAGLSEDMDPRTIIKKCGSFLTVEEDIVNLVHQSAKDFLLQEASKDIFPSGINNVHHSIFLQSLKTMENTLRRDIYGLCAPGTLIDQIQPPNPDPLVAARYSCIHWVDHLHDCNNSKDVEEDIQSDSELDSFLRHKFLYWLEALGLIRKISEGVRVMEKLETILIKSHRENLQILVRDARRFILSQKGGIEIAPLQAYASAIIFSPKNSWIRKAFDQEYPACVELRPKVEADWNACLQTIEGHNSSVTSVAFSPDGQRVASGSYDETVKIWDATSGDCLQTLEGHNNWVTSVAFSPDGQRVASGSDDKTVKIWDATSGDCLQILLVEHVIKNLSFDSEHDSWLWSNIGKLILNTSSTDFIRSTNGSQIGYSRYHGYGVSADGRWITQQNSNFCWLPPEFRPSVSTVGERTIVIGCASGRVLIMRLAPIVDSG